MLSFTSFICLLTPAIDDMFSASRNELIKSITVCVASGTIAIMSLKKSSSTGAIVALIAVAAFPADDDSSVNVFDTLRTASACVPVIC